MTIRFTQRMIQPIIIGILVLVIIFLRMCSNPKPIPCPPPSIVIHDSFIDHPVDKPYPVPYPVYTVDSFEKPHIVDTAEILADYFKLNLYDRVIYDSGGSKLSIKDSVTHNKLRGFKVHGNIKEKITIIEKTYNVTTPLKNRLFIGAQLGTDLNSLTLIPKLTLLPKSDRTLYSISYDPFNKYYYIGMDFKIHLGK